MKICYVGSFSNIHTQRWVRFFAKQGHEVHVITTSPVQNENSDIKLYQLNTHRTGSYLLDLLAGIITLPKQIIALKRLLSKIKPDVVHVHYVNEAAFFTLLTGFNPIILTAWGSDILISPDKSLIRMKVLQYILKKVDLITCDAEHMKERMINLGANSDKVKLIFFGTDVERFNPNHFNAEIRNKFAPDSRHIVISTRNHDKVYDIETLINAIPVILEGYPDTCFLIGGSGPLSGKLKEMVSSLGVDKNLRFLGKLSQDELPLYLASSDVYVSTSLSDAGLAASTAEAMASGIPVVITDVADNSKWVENDINGFLFAPNDIKDLAQKIIDLLSNKEKRLRVGIAGRKVIAAKNNLHKEMVKMEELYKTEIKSKNWEKQTTERQ